MELSITQVRRFTAEATDILRLDEALAAAERIAGRDGYIMTLPQLIDARLAASSDDYIWQYWFTGLSEEDHGMDKQGNKIYAVSHGKGPLTKSRRMKAVIDSHERLPYGYARLSDRELAQVLKNAIPLEEIKGKGQKLSESYTLVGKVDKMRINPSGMVSLDDLRVDDRFLMAVGSEERRDTLLDKIKNEFHGQKYGNWHRIGDVDYAIPQGRLLFLGGYDGSGLIGNINVDYYGRFLGVSAGGASRAGAHA